MSFVHLHVHTPWSFLDGASSVEDLVASAVRLGQTAMAITDHNTVSAFVRFRSAARKAGIKPIIGCELAFTGFTPQSKRTHHLTLLATGATGYANLCSILTRAHLGQVRGAPLATPADLSDHTAGIIAMSGCRSGELPYLILRGHADKAKSAAERYTELFGQDNFFIELQALRLPHTGSLNLALANLAERLGIETVATNNVHYATPTAFPLHDTLTCVRTGTTLADIHPARALNAEAYLKSEDEMHQVLPAYQRALAMSSRIADRCDPPVAGRGKLFPTFAVPSGSSASTVLCQMARAGTTRLYHTITPAITVRLEHELEVINKLGVADYFLVVANIIDFAQKHGIRYCGRGSSANSLVAHALGISDVDPLSRGLLFERFLSLERSHMPDIDIDIESGRRDEVIDYVYTHYGADYVASVCTFSTYQARSVLRDVGKALGFPAVEIEKLAKSFPQMHADHLTVATEAFPELRNGQFNFARYQRLFALCEQAAGLPRHVSTHLGGIVICRTPLTSVSPLQMAAKGVPVLQFDKNDVEELGLLKLDLLSLRTLGAVGATLDSLKHDGVSLDYSQIPSSDSSTYAMLNAAETVGVFQLESPSQRALQSVMCSTDMDDIVASIALIRPGPIRGNMVSPFIRRHLGLEEPTYTDPRLEPILGPTHGVILYQEQVLQVAMAIAGYTPGEADQLRRDMSDCRSSADMQRIVQSFTVRATAQGCTSSTAQEIADHLFAYAGYGFCQGHAEAFAATAYKTAYLIRHYPAHYLAALMSHQPLGFYPTHTLCVEAQRRGIRVLGPDINRSELGFAVGNRGKSIRTSLYQVKYIEQTAHTIIAERTRGGDFLSLPDFCHRVHPRKEQLGNLIKAGAFDCFDTNRRRMLWYMDSALQSTGEGAGLFPSEPPAPPLRRITDFSLTERVRYEQESLGYTVSAHPVQLWRGALRRRGFTQVSSLPRLTSGEPVQLAGLVVRPQRPATRSGNTIVFFSLEDESGLVDITVFERVYQRDGRHIFTLPAVEVTGHVERRGRGVSVVADALTPLSLEKRPT